MDKDRPPPVPPGILKKSVLNILNRRSTRVEPEPIVLSTDSLGEPSTHQYQEQQQQQQQQLNQSTEERQTVSAQSTPIKRASINNNQLRRHNSSQLVSDKGIPTPSSSSNGDIIQQKSATNRLSHQFGLCCSVDDRAVTPPVTVRYKSLPDIDIKKIHHLPHQNHRSNHQNGLPSSAILEEHHQVIVHRSPESPPPSSSSENENHFPNHQNIYKPNREPMKPVFNEYQHSIAMSACKSRLREKLLAGVKDVGSNIEQHSSSPNVSNSKPQTTEEQNRSFSYDLLAPASANSLARQSLIAAQLLNLIPTEKARERNYLSGRLAVNSLFGMTELERVLPSKEVKIFVGTWNMNEQNPPKQMNDFVLPTGIDHIPDLIVIGTQESCSVRFEWEVTLQETLGPSHILLHSAGLGTLHLAVFIRRDLIWFCSEPEDDCMSVRPGTAFRTKGAVAISFCLFGTTMLFVTSHLTAHQQKVKERVQDVKRIIHSLDLPRNLNIRNKSRDVTQNFDTVYWCGDLNFRLGEPREKVLKWIENTKFPLPSHMPNGYMHTDQLKSVLANGAAFKGFKEAHITFPPTYKYDPGTQNFDTSSKQRTPAYTDRILYKYKSLSSGIRRGSNLAGLLHTAQLECLAYDSVPSIVTSDHKPVWALFRCPIRPGIDSVPLAAGLFNREVYLEGMKRRLNNTRYEGSSAVCSIQ